MSEGGNNFTGLKPSILSPSKGTKPNILQRNKRIKTPSTLSEANLQQVKAAIDNTGKVAVLQPDTKNLPIRIEYPGTSIKVPIVKNIQKFIQINKNSQNVQNNSKRSHSQISRGFESNTVYTSFIVGNNSTVDENLKAPKTQDPSEPTSSQENIKIKIQDCQKASPLKLATILPNIIRSNREKQGLQSGSNPISFIIKRNSSAASYVAPVILKANPVDAENLSNRTSTVSEAQVFQNLKNTNAISEPTQNHKNTVTDGNSEISLPGPELHSSSSSEIDVGEARSNNEKNAVEKKLSASFPGLTELLKWENNVGRLPGCDLTFRMNELNALEIVEDDNYKNIKSLTSATAENFNIESITQNSDIITENFALNNCSKPSLKKKEEATEKFALNDCSNPSLEKKEEAIKVSEPKMLLSDENISKSESSQKFETKISETFDVNDFLQTQTQVNTVNNTYSNVQDSGEHNPNPNTDNTITDTSSNLQGSDKPILSPCEDLPEEIASNSISDQEGVNNVHNLCHENSALRNLENNLTLSSKPFIHSNMQDLSKLKCFEEIPISDSGKSSESNLSLSNNDLVLSTSHMAIVSEASNQSDVDDISSTLSSQSVTQAVSQLSYLDSCQSIQDSYVNNLKFEPSVPNFKPNNSDPQLRNSAANPVIPTSEQNNTVLEPSVVNVPVSLVSSKSSQSDCQSFQGDCQSVQSSSTFIQDSSKYFEDNFQFSESSSQNLQLQGSSQSSEGNSQFLQNNFLGNSQLSQGNPQSLQGSSKTSQGNPCSHQSDFQSLQGNSQSSQSDSRSFRSDFQSSQEDSQSQSHLMPPSIPLTPSKRPRKANLSKKDSQDLIMNTDSPSKLSKDGFEICCCKNCGCYGLSAEFFATGGNSFCSLGCSQEYTIKEAELKRKKDKLNKRRSRIKKRKMEETLKLLKQSLPPEHKRELIESLITVRKVKKPSVGESVKSVTESKNSVAEISKKRKVVCRVEEPEKLKDIKVETKKTDGLKKKRVVKSVSNFPSWVDSKTKEFSWKKYLSICFRDDYKAAPLDLWTTPFPKYKNLFKVNHKLEGIDPRCQGLFCVMSVVDVVGHRIRLHFDGYSEMFDFWCNADSDRIFEAGWCEKNGRKLETPPYFYNFNWPSYLEYTNSSVAPKEAFSTANSSPSYTFIAGMKLEAEDQKTEWTCVATVADSIDKKVLVHYDGWSRNYDTWFSIDSPYIYPVGYCERSNIYLYPPKNYRNQDSFNWPEYLQETKSMPVPCKAFKSRRSIKFKVKPRMKLEVVDPRNPALVRVGTIKEIDSHKLRIQFDGWSEEYDVWVEDDSLDLHPPDWCEKTGHPLEPPLHPVLFKYRKAKMKKNRSIEESCPTEGCEDKGHIKGLIYTTHHTSFGCPYSVQNLNKDFDSIILPDRLESVSKDKRFNKNRKNYVNLDETRPVPDDFYEDENQSFHKKRVRKKRKFFDEITNDSQGAGVKAKVPRIASNLPDEVSLKSNQKSEIVEISNSNDSSQSAVPGPRPSPGETPAPSIELNADTLAHQSTYNPGYDPSPKEPILVHNQFKHILSDRVQDLNCKNVSSWDVKEVYKAISNLPGCMQVAKIFIEQDIDGEVLLMLNQRDLIELLGLKLGPAIKILGLILMLRHKSDS